MNRRVACLLLFVLAPSLVHTVEAQRVRRGAAGASWSPDGKHVVFNRTWYDPLTGEEVEPGDTTPRAVNPRGPREASSQRDFLDALSAAKGERVSSAKLRPRVMRSTLPRAPVDNPGGLSSKDGTVSAAVFDGELWAWRKGGEAKKLADGLAGIRHFAMSPTGNAVSFIKDNNLFLVNTTEGTQHQLSKDGGENTFYGELDWVYQEEVYGRYDFQGAWWSTDGGHLAFMRTDEEGVDTFSVVDHIPNQLGIEQLKYPKAGRTNPRATLHVADASTGRVLAVDLSKYDPKDEILVVRVGWTPSGDQCIYMIQNREQTWLDLNFADPKTGKTRTLIHEESKDSWVERLPMPRWLADGSFLWESDRTGYRHFYRYDRMGKLLNTVSQGPWSADRIIKLDDQAGWIGFYGNTKDYSIGANAYYAKLDGSALHRVTKHRGNHRVSFNNDGSLVIDQFNSLENPGELWVRKNDGSDVRKLMAANAPENATFPQWKQIRARDGETLDIVYTLPRGFDPSNKYPVWINTYSGPAAPTVRDGYRGPARGQWYVELNVNVRSASTRGMKYTKTCYKQFGVQELKDIEDAIDWLCKHPWADESRVGITGWSYGGFMTAFALTHSKKFKCGIAGAGVYDWGLYDTIYTERYMQTPQNNPEGYRASSVVAAAKDLTGELLIVHGMKDDNVHMQNAIQFIHELQNAGKTNFTFMLYPQSRHGVGSRHLGALREKFMRENL